MKISYQHETLDNELVTYRIPPISIYKLFFQMRPTRPVYLSRRILFSEFLRIRQELILCAFKKVMTRCLDNMQEKSQVHMHSQYLLNY